MKKIILSIVLALATTVCTAQSVNDVISQFKGVKGVTCLNLDKTMIKLMGKAKVICVFRKKCNWVPW